MTDEALMLAYRDGDAAAFEALYRRWRGKLYRTLLRQCGSAAHAEELYQDIWLKVVNARKGYEVAAKFSTWLFRIAHNRLIDHYRSHSREAVASYERVDDDDCPIDEAAALPAAQRETFLLSEEGDMTLEEIAAATGVNRETAKSRLRYALNKLRAGLKELR